MKKCLKAQYFSYVIDAAGRVRGCGYNGTPPGFKNCTDGGCPRATSGCASGASYNEGAGLCLANHAEHNALAGIDRSHLSNSTLYVNGICCFGCAKEIVGAGVKRVVGIYTHTPADFEFTKELFDQGQVDWILFSPSQVTDAT